MVIQKKMLEFLSGEKFSDSLVFRVASKEKQINNRLELLENLCTNKKVVHVGFADHMDQIGKKMESNYWLHQRLINVSNRCLGADINKEAVEYISKNFHIQDIYHVDIVKEKFSEIVENKWDYIVLGEILEHVNNPVLFLQTIKENYQNSIQKIIITVPNAFDWVNIKLLRGNIEYINSDHRYTFTVYTLAKVLSEAGFKIESYELCQSFLPNSIFEKFLLKRFPVLREHILMIANL